jgi:hypothetical protein
MRRGTACGGGSVPHYYGVRSHQSQNPTLSVTGALHELLDLSHALLTSSAGRVAKVLPPRLLERIARHRVAARPGRHYPRPHDTQVLNKGKGKRRLPSKFQDNAA